LRHLYRIADIDVALEFDAFGCPTFPDIETGNDPFA